MSRFVVMFQNRFVPRVISGEKHHAIRGLRKGDRQIKAGDELSLRYWSGLPYRSKQVLMHDVVCCKSSEIILTDGDDVEADVGLPQGNVMIHDNSDPHVNIEGVRLDDEQAETLAHQDGFGSFAEMLDWHRNASGLPKVGRLIEWLVPA